MWQSGNWDESGNRAKGLILTPHKQSGKTLEPDKAQESALLQQCEPTENVRFKNKSDSKYAASCQIRAKIRFDQGAKTIGPDLNSHSHFMLTGRPGNESGNLAIGIQIVRFTIKYLYIYIHNTLGKMLRFSCV